jgi:hypothetical protein
MVGRLGIPGGHASAMRDGHLRAFGLVALAEAGANLAGRVPIGVSWPIAILAALDLNHVESDRGEGWPFW